MNVLTGKGDSIAFDGTGYLRGVARNGTVSRDEGLDPSNFRRESDSAQHDVKERQQIEILLHFFEASKNYCVCLVDMVSSTVISKTLSDRSVGQYYGIFLNRMAEIASSFGAIVVKNIGDSILYYFPETEGGTAESFRTVLRCGLAMLEAKGPLNRILSSGGLPDVSYRISCEYGSVAIAQVSTSSVNDIFGSTVNYCSRINSIAPPDGMVVGQAMYEKVRSFGEFQFVKTSGTRMGESFDVYIVLKSGTK